MAGISVDDGIFFKGMDLVVAMASRHAQRGCGLCRSSSSQLPRRSRPAADCLSLLRQATATLEGAVRPPVACC